MIPFGTFFVKERMLEIVFRQKKNDAWDGQVLNSITPMKARIIRSIKLIAITVFSFDLRCGASDAWNGRVLNNMNPTKSRIIRSINIVAITVFNFDLRSGASLIIMCSRRGSMTQVLFLYDDLDEFLLMRLLLDTGRSWTP